MTLLVGICCMEPRHFLDSVIHQVLMSEENDEEYGCSFTSPLFYRLRGFVVVRVLIVLGTFSLSFFPLSFKVHFLFMYLPVALVNRG